MALSFQEISRILDLYQETGKIGELPGDVSIEQEIIFNHLIEAVPQVLYQTLSQEITFLLQEENRLSKLSGFGHEEEMSRQLVQRDKLVEKLANNNQLKSMMGKTEKNLVAAYVVTDLVSLAQQAK